MHIPESINPHPDMFEGHGCSHFGLFCDVCDNFLRCANYHNLYILYIHPLHVL